MRLSETMRELMDNVILHMAGPRKVLAAAEEPMMQEYAKGLENKVVALGFHRQHVREALQYAHEYEEILDWLCLFVPEQVWRDRGKKEKKTKQKRKNNLTALGTETLNSFQSA